MQPKLIERYFFFGLLLATVVFNFFIFKPFWVVLVLGASFAIILYPLYRGLRSKKFPSWLASLLTVLLFVIILCGPLLGIGILVFNQSQNVYQSIVEGQAIGPFLERISDSINSRLPEGMEFDLRDKISDFVLYISGNSAKIFGSTLAAIFSFLLMLLSIFYFLKDGSHWRKALVSLSPLSDQDDRKIISRLAKAINGVVKGYLLIALIQGILMGIGLWIFGVPNPALWGVVAGISALVPIIGTSLVGIPAFIYILLNIGGVEAFGFAIWAVTLVGFVDNLLNPIIIGSKVQIPPLLILFSVLGGISLMGPIGILMGPLSMSLLYALVSIYKTEFRQEQENA